MFTIKLIGFTIILNLYMLTETHATFHNDVPDLRDVMRKEELQNDFSEYTNFEHENPMMDTQNEVLQERNAIIQSKIQPVHTFKKEFPSQQPVARIPMSLQPVRPQPMPNKVEVVIRPDESELKKSEKSTETFEKLLQFMTIMNQVDEYFTEKARSTLKSLARIAEDTEGNERRQL